ncbi:hypothetical protein MRB53_011483 [Persea americana]|uniref:Uncharacterized protein n=1 Tax=Persea americana TaxID=3435 RepID=A0ACC2LV52_PERAE|nr:hypothetical protein MRB53_011483 [Persea americana]
MCNDTSIREAAWTGRSLPLPALPPQSSPSLPPSVPVALRRPTPASEKASAPVFAARHPSSTEIAVLTTATAPVHCCTIAVAAVPSPCRRRRLAVRLLARRRR